MKDQVNASSTSQPGTDSTDSAQELDLLYAEAWGDGDDNDGDSTDLDNAEKSAFDDDAPAENTANSTTADTSTQGQGDALDAAFQNEQPQAESDWEQKYQAMEHRYKSAQGRLTAAEKRIETLKQLQHSQQSTPELDEEAQALLEEMPELKAIHGATSQQLANQQRLIEQMKNQQLEEAEFHKQQVEEEMTQYQQEQQALFDAQVSAQHPNFMETWNSPEFVNYYNTLDPFDQQRALHGGAQGVIATLNQFKAQHATAAKQAPISNRPKSTGSAPQVFEGEFDLENAYAAEYG